MDGGGKEWTVWTTVNNYYCGETSVAEVVTLAMPGEDYVTGGGHIIMENSSGLYGGIGTDDRKMNFGLVMKWNKSGKRLKGRVNIIFRRMEGSVVYNYQIRSNAINSLAVEEDDDFKKAVITTKANLKRIYPDGSYDDLGGNLSLIVTAWESKTDKTGHSDKISVQLAAKKGSGIYFTSNWSGGLTIPQTLNGGKIQIGEKGMKFGFISADDLSDAVTVNLKVYPNPFTDRLMINFVSPADVHARIDIYDATGRLIQTVFDSSVKKGIFYNTIFTPETPITSMYFYRVILGEQVFNGKVVYHVRR